MNILEQIIADKRVEIEQKKQEISLASISEKAERVEAASNFVKSLRSVPMGLIAEVKRKSPSAGLIREPFDPAEIAKEYEKNGAQAVSCLMDHKYFGGGAKDFSLVRSSIKLPMLYKEFVVDPWQIHHAKYLGASAVLLIVGALSDAELKSFSAEIKSIGLQPLVEVHDEEEMKRAVGVGSDCIGINNRNLKTFVTTLATTFRLKELAPANCTLISESGIKTAADVLSLKEAGAHGILVGESLLREVSPGAAASELMKLI